MSHLGDLIKILPEIWENRELIVDGVVNSVKLTFQALPEDEQNEIIRRRLICKSCPLQAENAKTSKEYFDIFGVHYNNSGDHCSICSCPIPTKTASLGANCGIKDDPKTKDLDYKWTSYKTSNDGE